MTNVFEVIEKQNQALELYKKGDGTFGERVRKNKELLDIMNYLFDSIPTDEYENFILTLRISGGLYD